MINEKSLIWAFAQKYGWFLLVVACEALPNEDYEVELAVYAGMQGSKDIVWVDSFAVEDCAITDVDILVEIAWHFSECPGLLQQAQRVLEDAV